MTAAAILGAMAVGLAGVSAYLAVSTRGRLGDGWALLAFLCLVSSCSKL